MIRQPNGHRWRASQIALRSLATPAGARCFQFDSQTGVRPAEVIPRPPPFELFGEFEPRPRRGPRAPTKSGDTPAQSKVKPLNERGLQRPGQAESSQQVLQLLERTEAHAA